MIRIKNPYEKLPGYCCFGCCKGNHNGLKLDFWFDPTSNEVITKWNPVGYLQGYMNVLHGGIQATILDELASWAVNVILKTGGVTSQLSIRYKKPVMMDKGEITAKAKILKHEKRLADIRCELFDSSNQLCAEANIQFFVYPPDTAKEKFGYPGIDAFI